MAESRLLFEAQALRDEIKSIERRIRLAKQLAAKLVEEAEASSLQSEEDTSDGNKQGEVEAG